METVTLNNPHDSTKATQLSILIGTLLLLTVVRLAYLHSAYLPLGGDEAQYWSWSQHLSWGYFSKPPMIAWVIWLSTHWLGNSEFAVRAPVPIIHAITSLFIYLSAARLLNKSIAFWSALTYIVMPGVSFSSIVMSTDPLMMMFWAIAFYFLVRVLENDAWHWWLASGMALGLSLMSKYTASAFILSLLLYCLFTQDKRWLLKTYRPYLFFASALLILSPNIYWNWQHHFASLHAVGVSASINHDYFHPLKMLAFIGSQFGVFGPISFIVLMAMIFYWRLTLQNPTFRLLLFFVLPLFIIMCVQGLLHQANANWAAPIYITATIAVTAFLYQLGKYKWLKATLYVNLFFAIIFYAYLPVIHAFNIKLNRYTFPAKRVLGWKRLGTAVAHIRQQYPNTLLLVNNRMLLAEMLFYAKAPLSQTFRWNPSGKITTHYELVTNMNNEVGKNFLFISYYKHPYWTTNSFSHSKPLAAITIPILSDRNLVVYPFILTHFKGYPSL